MCVCIHQYIYIHTYMHTHIHIYIHTSTQGSMVDFFQYDACLINAPLWYISLSLKYTFVFILSLHYAWFPLWNNPIKYVLCPCDDEMSLTPYQLQWIHLYLILLLEGHMFYCYFILFCLRKHVIEILSNC